MEISNTTFRIQFTIPANTFVDKEDGDLNNMRLFLYSANGAELPKSTWVSLHSRTVTAFSTYAIFANQPKTGYEYRLSAIDSSGSESHTELNILFSGPLLTPSYLRTIILSSTTLVMATSFSDADILFLLQAKMSTYLKIEADDFFNSIFTVTRIGNSEISMKYEFSIRQLTTHATCNLTTIKELRSKFEGAAAVEAFKEALRPQFIVNSISGERFDSACNYLSTGKPSIGISFGTLNIEEAKMFSIAIPSASFISPNGSNMRLTLHLRFQNATDVPSNYWMSLSSQYLDRSPVLQGLVTGDVASTFTTMSFKLVAQTPLLVESFQSFQVNLKKTTGPILFSVSMSQNRMISISAMSFIKSFQSFMTSYMRVTQSSFRILDVKTTALTSIVWTASSLATSPCKAPDIVVARKKLVQNDGSINETLRESLTKNLNFTTTSISIQLTGDCARPTVVLKIPLLQIPKYGPLIYVVPNNAFYDATYGNKLIIALLDINSNRLQQNSWIWYNNSTRTISGFPVDPQKQTYNFLLRATNVEGHFIDENITVVQSWTQPNYGFSYFIKFSYSLQLLPVSNVVMTFTQKLKTYFKQPSKENVIIFRPMFYSSNQISLYYQNTSLNSEVCDVIGSSFIRSLLLNKTDSKKPNGELIASMQPEFQIEEVRQEHQVACSLENRKPPYVNYSNKTVSEFFEKPKQLPFGVVSIYEIPPNAFIDVEEGNTRKLSLNLKTYDGQSLPINSWVVLNATAQTIFAFPTDIVYSQNASLHFQFRLVATDSDGKNTSAIINFKISGPPPTGYYSVVMTIIVTRNQYETHAYQTALLLERLVAVFGNQMGIFIRSYISTKTTSGSSVSTLIWSFSKAIQGACDWETMKRIQSKVFIQDTSQMSPTMRYVLGMGFEVTSIRDSLSGPCLVEAPNVTRELPELVVHFCGPFSYTIPDDTFQDKQDGNTRKLKLTLLQSNANRIPADYWLQFDSVNQKIVTVLTSTQSFASYPKEHNFILIATDSTNASVNTTVKVKINPIMPAYSHTFSIQTVYQLENSNLVLYQFVKKIQSYLSDNRRNFRVVSATRGSGNSLAVTWTNCSLRYSPCDVIGIRKISEQLQVTRGTINSNFIQAMQPEFKQLFLTETEIGPCLVDKPPVLVKSFGPITVTTCGTFKAQLPANTFNDEEQGDSRSLDVGLTRNPYYWVNFDSTKQEMAIVLTREVAQSLRGTALTVTLTATDLALHQVHQTVYIIIGDLPKPAAYTVSMSYFINTPPANGIFASFYDDVRVKILKYLSHLSTVSSLEFIEVSQQVSSGIRLAAKWSSCGMLRDKCNTDQKNSISSFLLSNGAVNQTFKSALLPIMEITSVNVSWSPVCKDNLTPPIVQNPLPVINIGYCGYKFFQIPANTFEDNIDGDTWNLTLSILNTTNQLVNENWFYFDKVRRGIWVVLSDDALSSTTLPKILTYKLKATTKRGLSISDQLRFRISQRRPNASFSIRLSFNWLASSPENNNVIVASVMERIASYLGGVPNDLHVTTVSHIRTDSGLSMELNIANCTTPYDSCNEAALKLVRKRIYDNSGSTPTLRNALGANVVVTNAQVTVQGACNRNNTPPFVKTPLTRITVHSCSDFNYTIPPSTFHDNEQAKLRLSVTEINGKPINGAYQWVNIDTATNTLYGIVTDSVIANKPASGYNFTIKATDNDMQSAVSHLIVQIIDGMPQKFYQFTISLMSKGKGSSNLLTDIYSVRLLNSYFSTRFANQIASSIVSGTVTSTYSICSLPNRCDENLASAYFNRILASQDTVSSELKSHFSSYFSITSVSLYRNPLCRTEVSPPRPSKPVWFIAGSYCGGFRVQVPPDLFSDKEDGGTQNLDLQLYLNHRDPVPASFWVQLSKKSQELYGYPSRETMLSYTNSTQIKLVAKDSSGQEGSVRILFSFASFSEPKVTYKFSYRAVNSLKSVDNVMLISSKIESFVRKKLQFSFGLMKHADAANGVYNLEFANCSASYNQCDIGALNMVKDLLITSQGLPRATFKAAIEPFTLDQSSVMVKNSCISNRFPVAVKSLEINVSLCQKLDFKIPMETFYDPEDGNTRNLELSFTKEANVAIDKQSWIQFDKDKQIVYGYPRLPEIKVQDNNRSYWLSAKDKEGKTAMTRLKVKLIGSIPQTTFKMTVRGATSMNSNLSFIDQEIRLINKIGFFFNDHSLSNLFYNRNGNQVGFSWSFCNIRRDTCDCSKIQEIRKKLQSLEDFKRFMQPEIRIQGNVEEKMLGMCARELNPGVKDDYNELQVQPGQFFYRNYGNGSITNSTTYMANRNIVTPGDPSWVKKREGKICGLLSLSEATVKQNLQVKMIVYKSQVRDKCGKEARDTFNLTIKQYIPTLSYMVTVFLSENIGNNCTKLSNFARKISSYTRYPKTEIFLYRHAVYNVSSNASMVVWGLRNITERNCTNGTVAEIKRSVLLVNGSVNPVFVEHMKPEFEVLNVTDEKSGVCIPAFVALPITSDIGFSWWIVVIMIIIILLLFFLWLIWICIPRCCWKSCFSNLGCCNSCCAPGGKYGSLEDPVDKGVLALPRKDELDNEFYSGAIAQPDDEADKDTNPILMPDDETMSAPQEIAPVESSPGFPEDFFQESDPSIEIEEEIQQYILPMEQSAPMLLADLPPENDQLSMQNTQPQAVLPPLYRRASFHEMPQMTDFSVEGDSPSHADNASNTLPREPGSQALEGNANPGEVNGAFDDEYVDNESQEKAEMYSAVREDQRRLPQPNIQYSEPEMNSVGIQQSITDHNWTSRENSSNQRSSFASSVDHYRHDAINTQEADGPRFGIIDQIDVVSPRRRSLEQTRRASFDDYVGYDEAKRKNRERTRRRSLSYVIDHEPHDYYPALRRASLSSRSMSESNLNSQRARPGRRISLVKITDDQEPQKRGVGRKRLSRSYFSNEQGGQSRRSSAVSESYGGDPSTSSIARRVPIERSFIDPGDIAFRPNLEVQNEQRDFRRERRSSEFSNRMFAVSSDPASQFSFSESFGDSDSGISEYVLMNEMEEALPRGRRRSRRASQDGRRPKQYRSVSSSRTQHDEYEMKPRRVSRAYINEMFIGDSNA
eukprot:gene15219-6422_t